MNVVGIAVGAHVEQGAPPLRREALSPASASHPFPLRATQPMQLHEMFKRSHMHCPSQRLLLLGRSPLPWCAGALELIRRSPMQLLMAPPDKPGRSLRATAAAAAGSSQATILSRQLTDKLAAKMGSLMGGPFPYTFRYERVPVCAGGGVSGFSGPGLLKISGVAAGKAVSNKGTTPAPHPLTQGLSASLLCVLLPCRDPSWLVQSLTHVSVLGGVSYQRLEFLGDALMDLIVSLRLLATGHGTQ